MSKDTSGPAFPVENQAMASQYGSFGMTLRDYFAAKAMQGLTTTLNQIDGEPFWNVIATDSYKMADAMLEARK